MIVRYCLSLIDQTVQIQTHRARGLERLVLLSVSHLIRCQHKVRPAKHDIDGGGVRGYSSLLILKRLMFLVAEIEQGQRLGYIVSLLSSQQLNGVVVQCDETYSLFISLSHAYTKS